MPSLCNTLIGFLHILTPLLSISCIGFALYLGSNGSTDCQKFYAIPWLYLGIIFLVVSLLGLIANLSRVSCFLQIYAFVEFLIVIAFACFTIFVLVVTNKSEGAVVPGRGYKEYKLEDYSHWLQKQVGNAELWEKIKSCLNEDEVCRSLEINGDQTASEFYQRNLSPIQSGCCKPPTDCGFTYKNATFWIAPKSGVVVGDSDCKTWINDQDRLCYDCKSCKAGLLADVKRYLRKKAKVNLIYLIFVACICALLFWYAGRDSSSRSNTYSRCYP